MRVRETQQSRSPRKDGARTDRLRSHHYISDLVENAHSMGLVVKNIEKVRKDLIGSRAITQANLLGGSNQALLDTGSMISIIPLGVLVKAKRRGFDIDSLEPIDKKEIEPVFDASNNPMTFLGAVRIKVQLVGGPCAAVAFHTAKVDDNEILIGTNALPSLGVKLSLVRDRSEIGTPSREPVTVEQRTYCGGNIFTDACPLRGFLAITLEPEEYEEY
ncbi:unnamed protein product [Nippostrongylus brasiliensis]|uniref:Peptidase A2 domain-containing protein n=1 Tax=Nippostrongylus brasiliensis TaxID=27835 RepID=A0A0N4XWB3_NIPBR|nr:unnamed protein product [Nippostrongylus brasiliensis]